MIICVCHRVTDRDIAREVAHGCTSFDDLQDATRVGTACGACREYALESFAAHVGGPCRDTRGCPDTAVPSRAVASHAPPGAPDRARPAA
ncbi:MAG: (2Fe-2S)-binding protein [Rubrivivax sp.]|nr:(2Fe-2S)-binding protein [Rubrivivax sp.]